MWDAGEMREAALDALAVLLPVECAGCGADDRALCSTCRPALEPVVHSRPLEPGLQVFAGLDYDGVVRNVMLALKRDGRTDAARALAPALAAAVVAAAPDPQGIEVVAVPGSRRAYRRRGYDPVRLLVTRAGLRGLRVLGPARPHAAQKMLGIEAREANLRGVFRVRRAVAGRRILLIDDVVTSGATLRELARVLRDAGAEVVAAATVASTPKRS